MCQKDRQTPSPKSIDLLEVQKEPRSADDTSANNTEKNNNDSKGIVKVVLWTCDGLTV